MHALVTGSCGLIGSEAVTFLFEKGCTVTGIDNDSRADFFGPSGSTLARRDQLVERHSEYRHLELDIRDRSGIEQLFRAGDFDLVIHTAAQPSHDLAARRRSTTSTSTPSAR